MQGVYSMKAYTLLSLLSLSAGTLIDESSPKDYAIRRFSFVVAANNGGAERELLKYAETDADAFSEVLRSLGGVRPLDEYRLNQPTPTMLRSALENLVPRLAEAQKTADRIEVIIYYSGHSDAKGLLLGSERFTYQELKAALVDLPADVRITILDACFSGAMTRQKGGVRHLPFLVDASNHVRGYAVLTSSSEDESAQESDRIGASFFTHYLISAMRGAGDLSEDKRVTLNEAYHFAFHETLKRTQHTAGGPQHPAYDIQLVGSGDVIMTDLRSVRSTVSVPKDVYGRFFFQTAEGQVAAEIQKVAGRDMVLGLEPGSYSVILEQDEHKYSTQLELKKGQPLILGLNTFTSRLAMEQTVLRGGKRPARRKIVPINVGVIPNISINGSIETPALNYLSVSLLLGYTYDLEGLELSLGGSWVKNRLSGAQLGLLFNHVGGYGKGIQLSLGTNNAHGGYSGSQFSFLLNRVGQNFKGLQMTLGANLSERISKGVQLSLVTNMGLRDFEGIQATTGVNVVAGSLKGLQGALFGNIVSESFEGIQLSSGINYTHSASKGGQIGGINYAHQELIGTQVGLMNYAKTASVQLGLINIIEETKGLSFGLLSYAFKDGIFDVRLSSSDVFRGVIALDVGTKYTYTGLNVSISPWNGTVATGAGLYIGGRLYPLPKLELSVELGSQLLGYGTQIFYDTAILSSLKLIAVYRPLEQLGVFAGPVLHLLFDADLEEDAPRVSPSYAVRPEERFHLWPGFTVGINVL